MSDAVLVVGASGTLGGLIARRLLGRGVPVRAMTRDPARLAALGAEGATVVAADLLMPGQLPRALDGAAQIVSTANSFLGTGAASPVKADPPAYRNLVAAATRAGIRRIVHVSAYGITPDSSVDYFRVKCQVDRIIQESGIPWVLLRPSAFFDTWVGMMLADAEKGFVRLFGDGSRCSNYVAAADVAEIAVRVLERPDIVNEAIDIGGPSYLSQNDIADRLERALGRSLTRRRTPAVMLRMLPPLIRPFNELTARLIAMGWFSASADRPLGHWNVAAERFGVEPRTVDDFLRETLGSPKSV